MTSITKATYYAQLKTLYLISHYITHITHNIAKMISSSFWNYAMSGSRFNKITAGVNDYLLEYNTKQISELLNSYRMTC